MEKRSIFSQNLHNYKDEQSKKATAVYKAIINNPRLLIIPYTLYQHLSKYNGFSLTNSHEYLSYNDIAELISINNNFNYDPVAVTSYYNSLPDNYRTNVDFIIKTDKHKVEIKEYLYSPNDSIDLYDIIPIDNTIYIVVKPGIGYMLNSKEHKLEFLTKLTSLCFNVMGDSNTCGQPFFRDLVQVL